MESSNLKILKSKTPYLIIFVIILSAGTYNVSGQNQDPSLLLGRLFSRVHLAVDDREKIRLNDSIDIIVNQYVRSDSVLSHNFPYLRNLGQILSPDSRLKIVNWNLVLRDGTNRYFVYIISKARKKDDVNKVYALKAVSRSQNPDTMKVYDESNWYGALYYSIQPFRNGKKDCYLLLGIDFGRDMMTRKTIDILTFDENGKLLFGSDCLIRGGKRKFRHVIEYSSDGLVSLRMNSRKMVVFDHISPYSSGHEGMADSMGAGLSFDGYRLKHGNWEYISNVDVRNKKK